MLQETLQSLGFAEKEARVYLAALAHGPATAHDLSEVTAIPRATVYLQLSSLAERGLITNTEHGSGTLYRAAPPERILEGLGKERATLEKKEAAAREILLNLKSLSPETRLPKVRLFEGLAGLEAMRAELLKHRDIEWYCLSGQEGYHGTVPPEQRRAQMEKIWQQSLRCKAIISGTEKTDSFPEPVKYLYERYLVPPDQFPAPGEVAIFGDTVALLSYQAEPLGILIQNQDMATAMHSLFQLSFERAKAFQRMDV